MSSEAIRVPQQGELVRLWPITTTYRMAPITTVLNYRAFGKAFEVLVEDEGKHPRFVIFRDIDLMTGMANWEEIVGNPGP
jgi:hypothetical protein